MSLVERWYAGNGSDGAPTGPPRSTSRPSRPGSTVATKSPSRSSGTRAPTRSSIRSPATASGSLTQVTSLTYPTFAESNPEPPHAESVLSTDRSNPETRAALSVPPASGIASSSELSSHVSPGSSVLELCHRLPRHSCRRRWSAEMSDETTVVQALKITRPGCRQGHRALRRRLGPLGHPPLGSGSLFRGPISMDMLARQAAVHRRVG
jgi:hypothetical protein